MKSLFSAVLFASIGLIAWCVMAAEGQATTEKCQAFYDRWHKALDANLALTEPLYFLTTGVPQELAAVNMDIDQTKIPMAYFLCEKITSEGKTNVDMRLYQDVQLLDEVSGVNLIYNENQRLSGWSTIPEATARFIEEWRQGVYEDPSKQVAQLCEERLSREGTGSIRPGDLVAIRRYGIFGLPELIRQISKHNSKHAFAAYLIITGQRSRYGDYIRHSDEQFKAKEAKIEDIKGEIEKLKAASGGDLKVMKQISAALAG